MDEQPATSANAIELRIEELSQLFHSLDPFPFREKDLDRMQRNLSWVGQESCPPISNSGSLYTCQSHKHLRQRLMRSSGSQSVFYTNPHIE
jgi:hypothetical protein